VPANLKRLSQIAKIKAANPDVLFRVDEGTPFARFFTACRDVGLSVPGLDTSAKLERARHHAIRRVVAEKISISRTTRAKSGCRKSPMRRPGGLSRRFRVAMAAVGRGQADEA